MQQNLPVLQKNQQNLGFVCFFAPAGGFVAFSLGFVGFVGVVGFPWPSGPLAGAGLWPIPWLGESSKTQQNQQNQQNLRKNQQNLSLR